MRTFTKEHRQKLREAKLGKKQSPEQIRKRFLHAKGRKHTEETKQKIGKSNKNKKRTKEEVEKMKIRFGGKNHPNYGKRSSEETRRKISEGIKKHYESMEAREKLSKSKGLWEIKRKRHFNSRLRSFYKYREWRKKIFERDKYMCVLCGDNPEKPEIDHYPKPLTLILMENNIETIKEASQCRELWEMGTGRTLCHACHKNTPTYGHKIRIYLADLINKQ